MVCKFCGCVYYDYSMICPYCGHDNSCDDCDNCDDDNHDNGILHAIFTPYSDEHDDSKK